MHALCSGTISLSQWESYVPSRAEQAQSTAKLMAEIS